MQVTASTLGSLGFDELKAVLAMRCRTEVGRQRALVRPFLDSRAEVLAAYALFDEAQRLKDEPMSLPIGGLSDIRAPPRRGGSSSPRSSSPSASRFSPSSGPTRSSPSATSAFQAWPSWAGSCRCWAGSRPGSIAPSRRQASCRIARAPS